MAWSWSHTNEAYANAQENLKTFDDETIAVICAEWKAYCKASVGEFNRFAYNWAIQKARKLIRKGMREYVESDIWDAMSEFATCDNGGFNAWCCPFGCHKVPFDNIRDEEERAREKAESEAFMMA